MTEIMKHFPLQNPRKSQEEVLNKLQNIIEHENKKFIILEAPVGSGKSAIAITMARWLGRAHILTPLKSLQNQYYHDFSQYVTLMKGRKSYPCTNLRGDPVYHDKIIRDIEASKIIWMEIGDVGCDEGPCKDNPEERRNCILAQGECPYTAAINVANSSQIIVHNFHSFIFQTHFTERFDERDLLVIDEAHITENLIRDFTIKKIVVRKHLTAEEEPGPLDTIDQWVEFFLRPEFVPAKTAVSDPGEEYKNRVAALQLCGEMTSWEKFVVKRKELMHPNRTLFEFVPESIGSLAHTLIFNYAKKVLLMSGTIYSKSQFCRNLGIQESDAAFVRIGSSFPVESRPIYVKPEYLRTTSHAGWPAELPRIAETCKAVMDKFNDVKGLIHVPSYQAGIDLAHVMKNDRLVLHKPEDFQTKIEKFYKDKGNKVFVSPVCQQGVDFKDDRARFQIVLRIPYLNAGDEFVSHKVKKDFPWYNYHALVVFGQQIGRINRSENDFGATILVDDRFPEFLRKNWRALPQWLKDAIKR